MNLLEEIINDAVNDNVRVSTLLRKCLVLEHSIKNEKFRAWVNNELDGYDPEDELPDYRDLVSISRGHFVGPFGSSISNQPLSLHVLKPEHRKLVENLRLVQPISSYEERPDSDSDAQIPWPPSLTVRYQNDFFQGYALNRAWQELPGPVVVGLVDTVRNRVLRFALELKTDAAEIGENVSQIAPATVERSVVNIIYGGNNLIASSAENVHQIGQMTVVQSDIAALVQALQSLGIEKNDVTALVTAIKQDEAEQQAPTMGARAKLWVKNIGVAFAKEGLRVGVELARKTATKWIMQYYGFDI